MSDRVATILSFALVIGLTAALFWAHGRYSDDCRARGGVAIFGYGGWSCVAGREIPIWKGPA